MNSQSIRAAFQAGLEEAGKVAHEAGDAAAALPKASRTLEAVYEVPFLAHATLEPMNATAHVTREGAEIWAPTQGQTLIQKRIAELLHLKPAQVKIHTTFLGGGFGRKFEQDFIMQAVQASKALGKPVKLIWSREEDTQHDFYRPAAMARLRAGIDANGQPLAWQARLVCPSILARWPEFSSSVVNGIDTTAVEGAAELPYGIPNQRIDYVQKSTGVPVGFWRSVGSSQNAFFVESFLDELAHLAQQDPLAFRLKLLAGKPRHRAVLEKAAQEAGWGTPAPAGRYRGLALHASFGAIVAEVAEISIEENRAVRVHRVTCAVDCGRVVNPDTVVAQMESAIVFGLTAALFGEITIKNGRVEQSNFPDYPMLKLAQTLAFDVHIVASGAELGGIGEPGTPPIAPAVANAVFAATGKRVRKLPIRLDEGVKV